MNGVLDLARPEIAGLQGYQCADKPSNRAGRWVRLNANESPWPGGDNCADLNRYPDSRPAQLNQRMAEYLGTDSERVLITRGSDDAIDLLVRTFCRAGIDSIMVPAPGFAMYALAARIQGAGVIQVVLPRDRGFSLGSAEVLAAWQPNCKLVFLCSPNNPTGNVLLPADIEAICEALRGHAVVVVDEAYIEFAQARSVISLGRSRDNLVVLRTLSKAHGLAASRVGAAIAWPDVVSLLGNILPPYPLPRASQQAALAALAPKALVHTATNIKKLLTQRELLRERLQKQPGVLHVWPSEANFLLVETNDAARFVRRCDEQGVLVRDCSNELLPGCVRVTVGSAAENLALLAALEDFADVG